MVVFAMRMLAELAPIQGELISESGEEFCFPPFFFLSSSLASPFMQDIQLNLANFHISYFFLRISQSQHHLTSYEEWQITALPRYFVMS